MFQALLFAKNADQDTIQRSLEVLFAMNALKGNSVAINLINLELAVQIVILDLSITLQEVVNVTFAAWAFMETKWVSLSALNAINRKQLQLKDREMDASVPKAPF